MHGIANMIPKELQDEFYGFMKVYDNEELSDGAWWALLEEAASSFIKLHKLKVDINDAPLLKKAKIGLELGVVSIDLTRHTFDVIRQLEKRISKLEESK